MLPNIESASSLSSFKQYLHGNFVTIMSAFRLELHDVRCSYPSFQEPISTSAEWVDVCPLYERSKMDKTNL